MDFKIDENIINLSFDLPVLYWKYYEHEKWNYEKPAEISLKQVPQRIYIGGGLNNNNLTLEFENDFDNDLEDIEARIQYDSKNSLYYFRTSDFTADLNRKQTYRTVNIVSDAFNKEFLNVICKSLVMAHDITGDFENNVIYGNFEISGSSEYVVNIKKDGITIEDNIPVIDGHFECECTVDDGKYDIELYEIEDDEFGFGAYTFLLNTYILKMTDIRKLDNKVFRIRKIQDRNSQVAQLNVRRGYTIRKLKKVDYELDLKDKAEIFSWLYDSNNHKKLSGFIYYSGNLEMEKYDGGYQYLCKVLVVFDNFHNINEVLLFAYDDGDYYCPILNIRTGKLYSNDLQFTKYERKKEAKSIDDDLYKITIEIGDKV